jgi:hypothetical protein
MVVVLKSVAGFGGKSIRWSAKLAWVKLLALAVLIWGARKKGGFLPVVCTVLAVLVTSQFYTFGVLAATVLVFGLVRVKELISWMAALKLGLGLFAFNTFIAMTTTGTLGLVLAVAGVVAGYQGVQLCRVIKKALNKK